MRMRKKRRKSCIIHGEDGGANFREEWCARDVIVVCLLRISFWETLPICSDTL